MLSALVKKRKKKEIYRIKFLNFLKAKEIECQVYHLKKIKEV